MPYPRPMFANWRRRWMLLSLIAGLVGWLIVFGPSACAPDESTFADLPSMSADLSSTTVSGLSSGAYMAGQFQLAHADIVTGAAIVAGGPYACAESAFSGIFPDSGVKFLSASRAVSGCMQDTLALYGVPDAQKLAQRARELSEAGRIGRIPEDVENDRLYIFSGTKDQVVKPRIVSKAVEFYREIGVPAENIEAVFDKPAGHAIVTMDQGGACDGNRLPYIVDCDYDQIGAIFRQLYPGASAPPAGQAEASGRYLEYRQSAFTEDLSDAGLRPSAVVYIPPACEKGGCRVHVAFHGCEQNRTEVESRFIRDTGYAPWADANDIVVLFPEVAKSPFNPLGCWDWWGYTTKEYLTREAPQIVAVRRMLDRLAERR